MDAAYLAHLVLVFVRRLKAIEDQRIERRILAVTEFGQFVLDAHVFDGGLFGKDVAERDAIVVGADLDGQLAPRASWKSARAEL